MKNNISFEQLEKIILEKIELANLNKQTSHIILTIEKNEIIINIKHNNNDETTENYLVVSTEENVLNEIEKISSFVLDRDDIIPMKSYSCGENASYIQMIKNLVIEYKGYFPKVNKINKKIK